MKNKKELIFSLGIVTIFIIAVVIYSFNQAKLSVNPRDLDLSKENNTISVSTNIVYVKIGGKILKAEPALTQEAQEKGLSGRESIAEDEAMLFVFNTPGRYAFWMKEMNFPIDMIWIGEDMNVVYIKNNAEPYSYPTTYGPQKDAMYVLETISGFSGKNNLKEGDKVEFLSSNTP